MCKHAKNSHQAAQGSTEEERCTQLQSNVPHRHNPPPLTQSQKSLHQESPPLQLAGKKLAELGHYQSSAEENHYQ